MKYDMNKEIKKYKVFYVHAGQLEETFFVENIGCYDHYTVQLHHFVPHTDWEKNTRNVREKTDQKLILMPIAMHQHLENPVYKLDKESFKKLYGIHPNELLFDVNSHDEEMQKPWKDTEMFEGLEDWGEEIA